DCVAGGVCSSCNEDSCADGCCTGPTCHENQPDLRFCGLLGEACDDCDTPQTDACSADGDCVCGTRSACGEGDRCNLGRCECDPELCAGCCGADGRCQPGTADDNCGLGGKSCADCSPGSCETGGVCSGCNPEICQNGCCDGADCHEEQSLEYCGTGGLACEACDLDRTDTCEAGVCVCEQEGAACGPGELCVDHACVCDPMLCGGCCDELDRCQPGTLDTACGSGGDDCIDCSPAHCSAGGVCDSCNADNCGSGCCEGSHCHETPSLEHCGLNADPCVDCNTPYADNCGTDGVCRCGQNDACVEGQKCDTELGECVCDPDLCEGCCNGPDCLPGTTNNDCGLGGVECLRCKDIPATCVDGECVDCTADTCSEGCCRDNQCEPGSAKLACGIGGEECVRCLGRDECIERVCQVP
ncbi:MAG: hypothetical protein JXR96_10165, partial [Deltaproteobacteria bacterium]|nr:hypothetical protein [Deltaproteobacteria bacterium]